MKQEDLFISALTKTKDRGLTITRGPMFSWLGSERILIACDASGALAILSDKEEKFRAEGFYRGWLKELCMVLEVSDFWFHRFNMGFNRNFQIQFRYGSEEKPQFKPDEVSMLGTKLAKEFVLK